MSDSPNYYAIIMAGGGGTRLWPLSRQSRPKQMLPLLGEKTLFQIAVNRLESLFPLERILVVTNHMQAEELQKQCPDLLPENFLIEPEPRGTAAAIALAAAYLMKIDSDAIMAVLTADHYIGNEKQFIQYLQSAKDFAIQGYLLTLGIEPTYAATQYGYIHQGQPLESSKDENVFLVKSFKEKPKAEEAQKMLDKGGYSWNSGMFIWRADRILEEFKRQLPEMHQSIKMIVADWELGKQNNIDQKHWKQIKAETIDYGIMENVDKVLVIPAKDMQWNDVGSWNSLFEVLEPDQDGNVIIGEKHLNLNSRNSLVHTNGQQKVIVTIGADNLVVVDTGDVLLICSKDQAQDVRQIIELLKENDLNGYL